MREAGKVAIGRVVIRSKQQLCALRPVGEVMALSTMLFGDEVLSPDRLDELDAIGEAEASDRELTMAQQLISSLSADFDPGKFKDDYRERVLELIERKAAGEEIAVGPEAAEDSIPAPDLMAALEASLAEVRSGDGDAPTAKSAPKSTASKPRRRTSDSGSSKGEEKAEKAKSTKGSESSSSSKSGTGRSRAKAKS
jgi:DNA end-binding protein Ku